MAETLRRIGAFLRERWEIHAELHERFALMQRPWEEDFLHWAQDADGPHLHGHLVSGSDRRTGVTRSGWCPGLRQQAHAARS